MSSEYGKSPKGLSYDTSRTCPNCGAENPPKRNFCLSCDYSISDISQPLDGGVVEKKAMSDKILENAYRWLSRYSKPFKVYPNPMRTDGVFVGQDMPFEPYPGVVSVNGQPVHPAVPQSAKVYPSQIPHDVAERLIERLNSEHGGRA